MITSVEEAQRQVDAAMLECSDRSVCYWRGYRDALHALRLMGVTSPAAGPSKNPDVSSAGDDGSPLVRGTE